MGFGCDRRWFAGHSMRPAILPPCRSISRTSSSSGLCPPSRSSATSSPIPAAGGTGRTRRCRTSPASGRPRGGARSSSWPCQCVSQRARRFGSRCASRSAAAACSSSSMATSSSLARERAMTPQHSDLAEAQRSWARRAIPFDYAFSTGRLPFFQLRGLGIEVRGHITVSIEASFVAVAIGYGFVTDASPARPFGPLLAPPVVAMQPPAVSSGRSLRSLTFGEMIDGLAVALGEPAGGDIGPRTADALRAGVRLDPALAERALLEGGAQALPASVLSTLLQIAIPSADAPLFTYELID